MVAVDYFLKPFFENRDRFNEFFLNNQKIGRFSFRKDDFQFTFHNYLPLNNSFFIEFFLPKENIYFKLLPNTTENNLFYFSKDSILVEYDCRSISYMNYDTHYKNFDFLTLLNFFSDMFLFYKPTTENFFSYLQQNPQLFNEENFALLHIIETIVVSKNISFDDNEFKKLRNAFFHFCFSKKKNNHLYLNTQIIRFLNDHI